MDDLFAEAAAELGCETDELAGTFPPSIQRAIRRFHEHADKFLGTHEHPGYPEHTHRETA